MPDGSDPRLLMDDAPLYAERVLELLQEIIKRLDRIETAQRQADNLRIGSQAVTQVRMRGPRLSDVDHHRLQALLPAILAAVGILTFTVASLFERAAMPGQDALAEALRAAGTPRAVGRLLRRAEGIAIAGLRLRCTGTSGQGLLWVVEKGEETNTAT